MAHVNVELRHCHGNRPGNIDLILRLNVIFLHRAAAVWTHFGQDRLFRAIHMIGNRSMTGRMSRFLARFLRRGFRFALRERRRLAFTFAARGFQRFFQRLQLRFQTCHALFQSRLFALQLLIFSPQANVFGEHIGNVHAVTLCKNSAKIPVNKYENGFPTGPPTRSPSPDGGH